jgi:hypothetical protein
MRTNWSPSLFCLGFSNGSIHHFPDTRKQTPEQWNFAYFCPNPAQTTDVNYIGGLEMKSDFLRGCFLALALLLFGSASAFAQGDNFRQGHWA